MASNREKVALRNENLQKVLPFINSNRGNFSGRQAQEAALNDFLQNTSLLKFQNNTRVKVEHTGKTLRDQLRAAVSSKGRSFEDLNVHDLFERGSQVFQPAFLKELGIGDTANAETERSADQAYGQAPSDKQSSETRTGTTWPVEQQPLTSHSLEEVQSQRQAARNEPITLDSTRGGSKGKPASDETAAFPSNRKRKNRPESEDHDDVPALKSPRLQSQDGAGVEAPAANRKRKVQQDVEQERELPAAKIPRFGHGEYGESSKTHARVSTISTREPLRVQEGESTAGSANSMALGAPKDATNTKIPSATQPFATDLMALEDNQKSDKPVAHRNTDEESGRLKAQEKHNETLIPTLPRIGTDQFQQRDGGPSSRKRKSDAPDIPPSPKRARTEGTAGEDHMTKATVDKKAQEEARAALAAEARQPTVEDIMAGRVMAPLRNVRERHAEAIGGPIREKLYPPEVESKGQSKQDYSLLVLRHGGMVVEECMREIELLMEGVLQGFVRNNNLNANAASAFVRQPDKELEMLYIQLFGSKNWEAAWLDRLNQEQPCTIPLHTVLMSLIGAAIHREVFSKELPWDVEKTLYERMAFATDALEETMADRGYSFKTIVRHAQFKLLNNKVFQEETVKPHASKVAEGVAMTIAQHLKAEKRSQFPDAPAHSLEAPSSNGEWVDQLRQIFKLAYILKGKLNTSPDAKYEYVWFKSGSVWDGDGWSIQIPYGAPRVRSEVIMTWLPAIKSEITSNRGKVEIGYCSPAKAFVQPIVDSARIGVTGNQARTSRSQRSQRG
ncbi:hypothetical protein KC343_g1355 [Hortaea werneckii]|nr:hypothetical protein KC352_g12350 [Hortaea werneckii]KAI7568304.1 hypothetical protein KC317_g4319 [Hortaea werneckii]KAI7626364.1 hypothetical protein KC346_g1323 [Hortaea werneckii]KAI7636297.1 hypothetical protein KC343_g1355 [Hortaea werneckii]KAI7682015.1 hypothetical protein KC319_g1259 [Hortaea werneckii]